MNDSRLLDLNPFNLWIYTHTKKALMGGSLSKDTLNKLLSGQYNHAKGIKSESKLAVKSLNAVMESIDLLMQLDLLSIDTDFKLYCVDISNNHDQLTPAQMSRFEQFWASFDYKRNRAKALNAWVRLESLTVAEHHEFPESLFNTILKCSMIEKDMRNDKVISPTYPQAWINNRAWIAIQKSTEQ